VIRAWNVIGKSRDTGDKEPPDQRALSARQFRYQSSGMTTGVSSDSPALAWFSRSAWSGVVPGIAGKEGIGLGRIGMFPGTAGMDAVIADPPSLPAVEGIGLGWGGMVLAIAGRDA
jgi:hypothetical protein